MLPENIKILKELEGLQLFAYPDPNTLLYKTCKSNNISPYNEGYKKLTNWQDLYGYPWTIGYGHTRDNIKTYNSKRVNPGDRVTIPQAEKILDEDIKYWEHIVDVNSKYFAKSNNQRDAFTIFAYNIGNKVDKLMSDVYLNLSNFKEIITIWINYTDYKDGVRSDSSFNRRKTELKIYFGNIPFEIPEGIKIVKSERQQLIDNLKKDLRFRQYPITSDTTVEEFLRNNNSLLPKMSKSDFLKFKPQEKTNADRIFSNYSQEDQNSQIIKNKYSKFDLDVIKHGTIVFLPVSELQEQLYMTGGTNLFMDQNQSLEAYFVEEQKELQQDPRYVKLEKVYSKGEIDVQTIEENCQVWIYVKAIDKLLDISSFINSLTISKTDIGQFSLNVNPIQIEINRESNSIEAVFISSTNGKEYLNDYEVKRMDGVLNVSFFEKYCQQNDTVFIRFEKLQLEEDIKIIKMGSHLMEVSKQSIPNQIFDMIGLVDSVGSNINFENTDYSINIAGRDLMKTLIEDGAYLIDLTFAKGAENMYFYLGDAQDKSFKRNFVSNGGFEYLFKEFFDPLDTYMGFIVNQLSNVGWSGDNDLFDSYPKDKTPKKGRIAIKDEQAYLENIEQNGVWKISHIKVDPNLKDRRIVDASFIDTDGTLYEQFKKVCQSPFVEFWGDTYGSQFNYIARQQPFDLKGMLDVLDTDGLVIDIETEDTFQTNLQWEDEFYSWIQFLPHGKAFNDDPAWLASSFPVIYFDKYVEHFGNHRYEIQDNYVSGKSVDVLEGKENRENVAFGLFNDLKYIIETVSILPFTRKGSLVINGDRRIKKGSFIYLKATKEVFYVEAVTNNVSFSNNSINRTTILSVKRGMKRDYINYTSQPNYFDIVNSSMITQELINRFNYTEGLKTNNVVTTTQQIKVDFGVNKDVFDFFLQRRQMDVI